MAPSAPAFLARCAPRPTAGAVLRPTGSPTTRARLPTTLVTGPTRSRLVSTHVCSAGTRLDMRSSVDSRRVLPSARGSSCLGRSERLHGQKRSPLPPARMSADRADSIASFYTPCAVLATPALLLGVPALPGAV